MIPAYCELLLLRCLWILFLLFPLTVAAQQKFTRYVDPFIGTGGHGHTFPGATMPFGMVQLSPDTRLTGWDGCSGYHYSDHIIYGFSHTHLSGTGISDYGDILLMPTAGQVYFNAFRGDQTGDTDRGYASRFSHQNETAQHHS
jgi:putative alpha-1,2-mannosidase